MWPMRSSPGLSVRGGRGGIMDRGRGRGRGAYHSVSGGGFSRPSLFPDEDGGRILGGRVSSTLVNGKQIVFNSLPLLTVLQGERWVERNGTDPGEWASGLQSTSPRKEYTSHGRGTSIESWRRPRGDEEVPLEQWRSGSLGPREPTKWGEFVNEEKLNLSGVKYLLSPFQDDRRVGGRRTLHWPSRGLTTLIGAILMPPWSARTR